jgi:cyclase
LLTKRIIPCLDVESGRVVKGISFTGLRDAGDPVELARYYYRQGADELVFLDITATPQNRKTLVDIVQRIAAAIFIPFTVGGGLRNIEDMRSVLMAGADKVSVNTAAVLQPALIREAADKFGSQCIVISLDAKRVAGSGSRWEVYINSGQKPTGLDALAWAEKAVELGAGEIMLTSIDADGHRTGYDLDLIRTISRAVSVPVIASGGAGAPEDLYQALTAGNADAVLAASIFHYGAFSIMEIKDYLSGKGIPVRR